MQALPKSLTTTETLQRLIQLLLEKKTLLRGLRVGNAGSRVTETDQATMLLDRVMQVTRSALDLDEFPPRDPKVKLSRRLNRLPRQVVSLYGLLLPVGLLFLYLTLHESETSEALWIVRGAIFSLFVLPLLFYRRARINIEHECGYVRDSKGRSVIVIDQLRTVQFQSYLAHEYGHHLYFELDIAQKEEWMREGWARLLQWQVMLRLYQDENNPAYLYHVLLQIIGELKFACELISRIVHHRLPRQVRFMRTIYQRNPVLRLLTGTPGFDPTRLIEHAVGTAVFFLQADRIGPRETLLKRSFDEENREARRQGLSTKEIKTPKGS